MDKQTTMSCIANNITPLSNESSNFTSLIPQTLRTHCVSVRLNNAELSKLNALRGDYAKGEWLRMASLQKLPTIVPPVNIDTWKTLGEINQKLNRIALHIDSKSIDSQLTHTELFAVKRQLQDLRQHLLNADIWSKPYEGYAEDKKG